MDGGLIRLRNIQILTDVDIRGAENLPLLDISINTKNKEQIVDRCLCIYALLAVSFGFSKDKCIGWLTQEELIGSLSSDERDMIFADDLSTYKVNVESLWVFAWSLGLVDDLKPFQLCDDSLSSLFPKISRNDSTNDFRRHVNLRSSEEIFEQADLAYILHWAMIENQLRHKANFIPMYVIEHRRKALDWMISDDDWDEISLNT